MSSINPNNIDGQYPIAGQDNDSQGFRDNFTNIKNNFTYAYNELTDLQSKVVLKGALSGGSLDNNMSYSVLEAPQFKKAVETKAVPADTTGNVTVNWASGHFQTISTTGDITLGFSGWPTSGLYTKLRLEITTDTTSRTVTFPSAVSVGLSDVQGASGQTVTLPTAGVYLFELTTYNAGTTVTIQDLLRNYDIVTTGSSGTFTSLNVSGNILASSIITAGLTSSTLTTTGAVVNTGVQLYVPTANTQTFTGNVGSNKIIIAPKPSLGADSYQLVTLPNVTTNGTTFSISANVTTYVGTFSPWVGTGVDSGANVAVAGGTSINFIYNSSQSKWFKV